MSSISTLERVRLVMEDVFEIDDLVLTPQTTAEDIWEWDSLSHIRLVSVLENRFKIKFKNSEVEGLMNVGDLIQVIERKIG